MTVFDRWPVDLVEITQDWAEINTWENPPWHKGIDIRGTTATAIKAPCDGFIVHASFVPFAFGNTWEQIPNSTNSGGCIILQPPAPHTAFQTSFSHLSQILVVPGQWVTAGQIIGYMGTTGNSSGVHLHWECFIDYSEGQYPAGTFYGRVDPKEFFKTVTVVPVIDTGGKGSTAIAKEWYLMPNIPTDNLLQIEAALMSKDYGAWLQQQVVKAPIKSTDGKVWPLHSHVYGITQRQQQQDGKLAGMQEILRQLATANGTPIDYEKVTEAVRVGVEQGQKLTAQEIADSVLDEQAERLTVKGTTSAD